MGNTAKLLAMYEEKGFDKKFPDEYEELKQQAREESMGITLAATNLAIHKEAELVLISLATPGAAATVKCPMCKEKFQTNYAYQRYCSTTCLKSALEEKGITWDPRKSVEDRWKGEPPSVISPTTLKILQKWAHHILEVDPDKIPEPQNTPPVVSTSVVPTEDEQPNQQSLAMSKLDQILGGV